MKIPLKRRPFLKKVSLLFSGLLEEGLTSEAIKSNWRLIQSADMEVPASLGVDMSVRKMTPEEKKFLEEMDGE